MVSMVEDLLQRQTVIQFLFLLLASVTMVQFTMSVLTVTCRAVLFMGVILGTLGACTSVQTLWTSTEAAVTLV